MTEPTPGGPPPPPSPPAAPQEKASGRATTALILGILGLICCPILAPIAWVLGNREGKDIQAGTAPKAGETLAKVGMILGIIGTVILVIWVIWVIFFGGMAMLGAMMEA